jgi:sugar (pentulose or hexulose) kinase
MTTTDERAQARDVIAMGRAVLGIEFGSTRIKSVLVDPSGRSLAAGGHNWENRFVERMWTYTEHAIWTGLQDCYASMAADAENRYGVRPTAFAGLGVSAMMHGYLPFDADGELLVPFRTWRNTTTGPAATELTTLFGFNIPHRWSVAHLYQAMLDDEAHIASLSTFTTLAGWVHRRLTGEHVLGVGDASGMFPVDTRTGTYNADLLARFDAFVADRFPGLNLARLLPAVLPAGREAGRLTADGAILLDPSGTLEPGAPLCPPEGDAGTGMVATNAVRPRTGNVSIGTSVFLMAVLEEPINEVHEEVDIVTTPAGDPVAMVHCNNGASELDAWAGVFGRFAFALGHETATDEVFRVLLHEALEADADAGGLLAYNYLSGEPVTGLDEGRPMLLRTPESRLTLGNFVRAQVYGAFATLALGMRVLADQGVALDVVVAHGGLFRTEDVAQRLLAATLSTRVAVGESAGEGGAWGIALLARYLEHSDDTELVTWLDSTVFGDADSTMVEPDPVEVEGFASYLDRFESCLEIEKAAVRAF